MPSSLSPVIIEQKRTVKSWAIVGRQLLAQPQSVEAQPHSVAAGLHPASGWRQPPRPGCVSLRGPYCYAFPSNLIRIALNSSSFPSPCDHRSISSISTELS
jgi:hypothetical protein